MELIYAIAALSSALAAVLAWIAKIRWSKEFADAKNETIKSRDAQIEVLRERIKSLEELNPIKIREYFLSVKAQLEEYIEDLKLQLKNARNDIKQKEQRIIELHAMGEAHNSEITNLENEKMLIQEKADMLEIEVKKLFEGITQQSKNEPSIKPILDAVANSTQSLADHSKNSPSPLTPARQRFIEELERNLVNLYISRPVAG